MWAESHISMYRHESIPLNQRHYSNDWTTIPPPKHPRQTPHDARPIHTSRPQPPPVRATHASPLQCPANPQNGPKPPPVRATHASPLQSRPIHKPATAPTCTGDACVAPNARPIHTSGHSHSPRPFDLYGRRMRRPNELATNTITGIHAIVLPTRRSAGFLGSFGQRAGFSSM